MSRKVIIAEDHPIFCMALQNVLTKISPNIETLTAGTINELQELLIEPQELDLIILDLHMPGAHGFSALLYLASHYPNTPIAVVSARNEEEIIVNSIKYGALSFIPKISSPETIFTALKKTLSGQQWIPESINIEQGMQHVKSKIEIKIASLTPQQFRVLGMVGDGYLNKQIAHELNVTEATVKAHVTGILKKLNVTNRTQAVLMLSKLELAQYGASTMDNITQFTSEGKDDSHTQLN